MKQILVPVKCPVCSSPVKIVERVLETVSMKPRVIEAWLERRTYECRLKISWRFPDHEDAPIRSVEESCPFAMERLVSMLEEKGLEPSLEPIVIGKVGDFG